MIRNENKNPFVGFMFFVKIVSMRFLAQQWRAILSMDTSYIIRLYFHISEGFLIHIQHPHLRVFEIVRFTPIEIHS